MLQLHLTAHMLCARSTALHIVFKKVRYSSCYLMCYNMHRRAKLCVLDQEHVLAAPGVLQASGALSSKYRCGIDREV